MQQILVYSDSLTWGIIPTTRQRLGFAHRWPGVMEAALLAAGKPVRVIENCLNGRRTAFDDPFKPGRNGLHGIEQVMEMHAPLSLAIVMLGTNDFQSMHPNNAWHATQGCRALVDAMRRAPIEPGMPVPPILLMSPPPIEEPKGPMQPKFLGGDIKCVGLAEAYAELADELDCAFFNVHDVTPASKVDGIHLDKDQHHVLGKAMAEQVMGILG